MRGKRIAWGLAALAVILTPFSTVTQMVTTEYDSGPLMFAVGFALVQLTMVSVGAVIASRLPRHRVGWLLLLIGVGLALRQGIGSYAEIGNSTSWGPLPADDWAAWLGDWPFVPIVFGGVVFLLHLFPTGHFPTPTWRILGQASAVIIVAVTAQSALEPGPLNSIETVENPVGATGWLLRVVDAVGKLSGGLALLVVALAVASMVSRTRRAGSVEREQIKWIVADLVFVGIFLVGSGTLPDPWYWICLLLGLAALAAMPVAAGIAIMRYRLYDIDVVINRALVYGSLTASLAGFYVGSVLLLQLTLSGLTDGSAFAVAASTLAVAALFRPVRTRIQRVVDRRFFRSRYDAGQTVEVFGVRVRDEVDLGTLSTDLLDAARTTVQPSHASLWLRSETP